MKAMFENGKIINIVSDNYKAGNPVYDNTMQKVESVDFPMPEKGIMGSAIMEYGSPKYYLDSGVLKAYTDEELQATTEYSIYRDCKLHDEFLKNSDGEFFKAMAEKYKDDPVFKPWIDKRNKVKENVG